MAATSSGLTSGVDPIGAFVTAGATCLGDERKTIAGRHDPAIGSPRLSGEKMAQSGVQKTINAAGKLGFAAASGMVTWATATFGTSLSRALATLLAVLGFVAAFAFALTLERYAAIITRRGPHERAAYDGLRQSLVQGGLPARIYSERLRAVLDGVDRFFGDAGMAERTLWPRAFWLRTPAPLWTAPAFDRCLGLALFYPIAVVWALWMVSGHVGPAEHALLLRPDVPGWQRLASLAVIAVVIYCGWRWNRVSGRRATLLLSGASLVALAAAAAVAGAGALAGAGGSRWCCHWRPCWHCHCHWRCRCYCRWHPHQRSRSRSRWHSRCHCGCGYRLHCRCRLRFHGRCFLPGRSSHGRRLAGTFPGRTCHRTDRCLARGRGHTWAIVAMASCRAASAVPRLTHLT